MSGAIGAVPPSVVPSGVAALTAPERTQTFTFERLTRSMGLIGELDGVTGGRVSRVASATIHSGGSLDLADLGQDIDWASERIRIAMHVEGYGSWGLGVFVPSVPREAWTGEGRTWSVELMGLETVLQRQAVEHSHVASAGATVTDLVRSLIGGAGESAGAITDSDKTVAIGRAWEPGTRVITIINDLLDTVNYFSLWADGNGQFRAEPSTLAAARPLRWEFTDGPDGIYSPDFEYERDLYNVPNKVLAKTSGDDETPGLVSIASNDDPDDPLSTVHRGEVYTDDSIIEVDAADQGALDGIAARKLETLRSPSSTVTITALPVPLAHNDACRFARTPAGIDGRFVVGRVEYDLSETGLMTVELRRVAA